MEVSRMACGIIKMIDDIYDENSCNDCLDILQIRNICKLYSAKIHGTKNVTLSEISISSPEFEKIHKVESKKRIEDVLKTNEFIKKYSFFIKTIYVSLKVGVEIFNTKNGIITLKNNHQFIRSLENKKKQIIMEHISILKMHYKNISQKIGLEYERYYEKYLSKIKIIDRVSELLNKSIQLGIMERTDNLLTLILPYFYVYTDFIEEYN
jgi:hypothetical protein